MSQAVFWKGIKIQHKNSLGTKRHRAASLKAKFIQIPGKGILSYPLSIESNGTGNFCFIFTAKIELKTTTTNQCS